MYNFKNKKRQLSKIVAHAYTFNSLKTLAIGSKSHPRTTQEGLVHQLLKTDSDMNNVQDETHVLSP